MNCRTVINSAIDIYENNRKVRFIVVGALLILLADSAFTLGTNIGQFVYCVAH